jgi:hypothetical protein
LSAFLGDAPREQFLSPLSFQAPADCSETADNGLGFSTISLERLPPDRPHTRASTKTFSLLKFEGPGTQAFCGSIIAKGGRFCTKLNCNYSSHHNKAWEGGKMEPSFYIVNQAAQKAYFDPFLLLANEMYSRTGRSILADGEQTLDAWAAIFCHLQDASRAINEEVATREGDRDFFYEEEDAGLQRFTTAMKTPGRWGGVLNPLASPKRLQLEDSNPNDEASSASQAQPQGPWVTDLKHALALIKGELGMRDADATYNTVHGGLQGLWTGLESLEARHIKQGETLRCCQDNVDLLTTGSKAAWGKSNKAMHAVEQLANFGGQSKVSLLESQLATMSAKVTESEATLKKASTFVMDLSAYVSSLSPQQSTG